MFSRLDLATRLRGPLPALPRPLDAASDRWASLSPRLRLVCAAAAIAAAVGVAELRVAAAESKWGGPGVEVLVAATDLDVGAAPEVRSATFPPNAVPPAAIDAVDDDAVLALAIPEGAVLTKAHVNPAGPAAGLPPDMRVVPIPVERGWQITAGGWVDVWALSNDGEPGRSVARSRPVVDLATNDAGRKTALVALETAEVAEATAGIALGRILLTHAPAPQRSDANGRMR